MIIIEDLDEIQGPLGLDISRGRCFAVRNG
jgi:hypothetical protein